MIQLSRDRTAVNGGFRGAYLRKKLKKVFKAKKTALTNPDLKIEFKNYWKNTKPQLEIEACEKCGYCEASTKVVAHGDVEHYRPKSIYWWLAYTYDNYIFSCQICNQSYKSDGFPVVGNLLMPPTLRADMTDVELDNLLEDFVIDPRADDAEDSIVSLKKLKESESAVLLNPYLDDPEEWFEYEYDDNKKTVALIAKKDKPEATQYLTAAEEFLGLNREQLLELRYKTFRIFRNLRRALPLLTDIPELFAETELNIKLMQEKEWHFSGMCRYFGNKPIEELKNTPTTVA